jgi:AsmA family protein
MRQVSLPDRPGDVGRSPIVELDVSRAAPMTDAVVETPPRRRARTLGRAVALLFALAVVALLLQPWWLAPLMSRKLSASAQRAVRFDSMWVTFTAALQPVVHLRGVRIENAPWADSRRPFAALGAVTAVFSWASVREQRPVIALMTLRDGEVDLERRSDGLRNWRLSHPDDRGPGRFKVLAIRGENASVRFVHERIDLDLEARASPRGDDAGDVSGSEAMPTHLTVGGHWRGVPFAIDATTGEVLTFAETGQLSRVRGEATSGPARLEFDGRLGDMVRDPLVDARVALTAPSLAPFAAALGPRHPDVKAIAVAGELKGEPGRYALSIAKGRLGATDLAGEVSWKRGEQRDLVHASLTSESASLADLRSLAGRRPAKAVEHAGAAASAPASASEGASAPARARPIDTELSYSTQRLHGEGMPWLRSARVDATLADGRLTVSHFDLGIGAGRAVGKANVDTGAKPMRSDVEVEVSAVRIESLLPPTAARSMLSGTLHGRAALKASGDSADALLASASGTVNAFVTGGTISSLLDAKMGLQGGRVLRGLLAGAERMPVRCAAAVLDLQRGTATIRSLVLDTERTRTTGSGTIDLAKEAVDVVLTPDAKQPGLFNLDRSIRLHGPLREARHELVARVEPASAPVRACPAERP